MKIKLIISYLKTYWLTATFFAYMGGATIFKTYTSFDITVPCMIRYSTGHSCYGCGLTTAVTHLLRLDISAAYLANPLVFIVLPTLGFLLVRHWLRFKREQQ